MIRLNIFSGHLYNQTDHVMTRDDGKTFFKCGSFWFGQDDEVIYETESKKHVNLNNGVHSSFGDPFGDKDAFNF